MTTPRDTDDLASALLDGLLTDDEAAAARRDPAVAARLAALAAVREEVGRPPARPDPVARERGLAAALAAFDAGDVADERRAVTESVGAAVSPRGRGRTGLQPATSRTGTPWRAHGSARRRWLTAAAVMLVVVSLGALARNWGTSSDDTSTAAQEEATDESSNGGGAADSASEGGGTGASAAPGAPTAGAIVDLGDVDSSDALADRARSILAERFAGPLGQASRGEGTEAREADGDAGVLPATCSDDAEAERLASATETVVLQAHATLDGEPVDVWVLGAEGEERVVAVDASCAVVVDQPLQR